MCWPVLLDKLTAVSGYQMKESIYLLLFCSLFYVGRSDVGCQKRRRYDPTMTAENVGRRCCVFNCSFTPHPVRRDASRCVAAPQCSEIHMENSNVNAATDAPCRAVTCRAVPDPRCDRTSTFPGAVCDSVGRLSRQSGN